MEAKISVGILCYNEADLIGPCIDTIAPYVSEVIISDGLMYGTIGSKLNPINTPSSDGTLDILEQKALEYDNIVRLDFHHIQTLFEKDIRNLQLKIATGNYFLIVDADEIWGEQNILRLKDFLKTTNANAFSVPCKNFFYNPNTFINQYLERLFKISPYTKFRGNNEIVGDDNICSIPSDICNFFHYGYIDRERVRRRCELYSSIEYYHCCGPWWYDNIYSKYDGTNFDELRKLNGGTFHLFGKRFPQYGKDSWVLHTEPTMHPKEMKPYLESQGFGNVVYF